MYQENSNVLWNEHVCSSYYKMGLTCDRGYGFAQPGQFVMIRIGDGCDPLLRRPFSIHRLIYNEKGIQGIELLYKVVGKGTRKLTEYAAGNTLNMVGPLGRGFSIPDKIKNAVIVVGGIGIAPMLFLSSRLKEKNIAIQDCKIFVGGRSGDDLLCENEFYDMGFPVCNTTDDGSTGQKGLVTDAFETALKRSHPDIIYACGPLPMLREVKRIAQQYAVACQLSIETIMACGMGACMGCAIESGDVSGGYVHACLNGPVFNANEIKI